MSARIGTHEIRNAIDPQPTPKFPIENYVDLRSGTRYRREYLGYCHGGVLLVSDIAKSSGIDVLYHRTQGNPNHPKPGELSDELRRWLVSCWQRQLRQSGKPEMHRQGALVWLGRMPLGCYGVDSGPGGGSVLFRYVPLVQRQRGALAVPLAHAPGNHSKEAEIFATYGGLDTV